MPVTARIESLTEIAALVTSFEVAPQSLGSAHGEQMDQPFFLAEDMVSGDVAFPILVQYVANGYLPVHNISIPVNLSSGLITWSIPNC